MYRYNKDAKYSVGSYNPKTLTVDTLDIAVSQTESFEIKVLNPLTKYLNPSIKSDSVANMWLSHPMQFYQNQLNFAVHCATTGCGLSYANHLNYDNPLVRSVYNFHFYYQFRRILTELQAPLPHSKSWNPFNNRINMKAFERLCNEFNINTKTNFRQNLDKNHGMGTLHLWGTGRVYNYEYWSGHTSFSPGTAVRLGSIRQEHANAWSTFILDTSNGFTKAGIERINDSIRTYVWCILGSQAQTKSNIADSSTGFDAQKQFLANLEDCINSAIDLPSSIQRYEDVLRYARSKVDFAVGGGLYMLPSDLRLQIGTITNYNNHILIAPDAIIGKREELNSTLSVIQRMHHPVPERKEVKEVKESPAPLQKNNHDHQKKALVFALTMIGLLGLYFTKK